MTADRLRGTFGQYLSRITQHAGGCPDCDSDVRMTEYDGIFRMTVLHDATCPTLAAIQDGTS